MRLPRFLANIVRAGSAPEIVTTRNFDELGNVLTSYATEIETQSSALAGLSAKFGKLIPPAILGKGNIWDVRSFGTIQAAVTALAGYTGTLYITNAQTITADLDIPTLAPNLSIVVLRGGSFIGAYTITFGPFDAGYFQVFLGSIIVKFTGGSIAASRPHWWGMSQSSTDCGPAIQSAHDCFYDNSTIAQYAGGVIDVPIGIYKIATGITFSNYQITFSGRGRTTTEGSAGATTFLKAAGMSAPVFLVTGTYVSLNGFHLDDAQAYAGGAIGSTGDGIVIRGNYSRGSGISVCRMGNDNIRFGETGTHHNMNYWFWKDIVSIKATRDGFHLEPQNSGATAGDLNGGLLLKSNISLNGRYGIYMTNANENAFESLGIESNYDNGIRVSDGCQLNSFVYGDYAEANGDGANAVTANGGAYDIYEEDSGAGVIAGNYYAHFPMLDARFRRGTGTPQIDLMTPTTGKHFYNRTLSPGRLTLKNDDNNLFLDTITSSKYAVMSLYDNGIYKGYVGKHSTTNDIRIADATADRIKIQQGSALILSAAGSSVQINAGILDVADATDATTPTAASSKTAGGLGVAKSIYAGTKILSIGPTSGIGYATGAGGTVTQATSKATGVTLNNVTGEITMNNAALLTGVSVSFTLTNSAIAATDFLMLKNQSGGTPGAYTFDYQCAAGSAVITVTNRTIGTLSEAIVLGFAVFKGVIT